MLEISKTKLVATTKEIGLRAIPYLLVVPTIIILHLLTLALWYYFHQDVSTTARVLVVVFGIVLPILAYVPWGIKRFIAGAYLGIHNNIIQPQLHPFCKKTADLILDKTFNNSSIPNHIILVTNWKTKVDNYLNSTPAIIQFVVRLVTRKLSFTHSLMDNLKLIGNKDSDGIANLLNQELALALITTSKNVVPKWVTYIIPLTFLFFILIWFI